MSTSRFLKLWSLSQNFTAITNPTFLIALDITTKYASKLSQSTDGQRASIANA